MVKLQINRFYILLGIVMFGMAMLVIFSLRVVFSAISTSRQIDETLLSSTVPHVNESKLNEAITTSEARQFTPLDF